MDTTYEPYITQYPGDLITAEDSNELQIMIKEEIAARTQPAIDGIERVPTAETETEPELTAEFTINGQQSNQQVPVGTKVALQAKDTSADGYQWEVFCTPAGCEYELQGESQAILTLNQAGAYVVQLTTTRGDDQDKHRLAAWAVTPVRGYRLPATGEPLRFTGDKEWAGDLGRAMKDVDTSLPTTDQKAALDNALEPGGSNPLATMADVPEVPDIPEPLTDDQRNAIKEANEPGLENPFATMTDVPEIPDIPEPLTDDQLNAIKGANEPGLENPFATMVDVPEVPDIPEPLTDDQLNAIKGANEPGLENPFATTADVPEVPDIPEPLTDDQLNAIKGANEPGLENPFVTRSELQENIGLVVRAAGCLNLETGEAPPVVLGGLRVVEIDSHIGRAKISFDDYDLSRKDHYLVNALTVHDHPRTVNRMFTVELVRFEDDGFTIHMSHFPPGGRPRLSPQCMIEVSEIV